MIDMREAVRAAEELVKISQRIPSNSNPSKSGGLLTIVVGKLGFLDMQKIGNFDKSKMPRYVLLSYEKAHRLYAHSLQDSSQVSSWQTRNPQYDEWGGAVLFRPRRIISFSGLVEPTDEALSLTLGYHLGFAEGPEHADRVLAVSQNPAFPEMFQAFFGKPYK